MSVLEARGVTVALGGRPVLHDVDLAVDTGELTGLIGPNGAGKTTLLRSILGLVRTSAGRIEVDGRPVGPRRSPVGYVPQRHEFAWDFPISVENAVMTGRSGRLGLFRRPGVADWQAVGEALDRVGMSELARRPVGELSGGQRQRVLVARALALQPRVLLLDEPFTGLDLPTQELLTGLFVELSREDRAVLMTTHDLVGALDTCTRIALLNRTIVADAPPSELLDPEPWMRAFGVSETSPLLKILKVM
ncbi:anchored repeat-type ABC transporter ATP-binding subunit [Jiangella ureilytica]|uniref:Anchored repeat-type ABC transporter ATP-binding subunit n=1 Tax=Jiangella ureilytica TaxID=2530374 RepID=A0A4R4RMJ8_9ACTN|nr:anchored repeat-type ABC transporter ATP-binding subunit [Jiangella ureilytica]TDC49743.1 anchored repeat-type ABC transporter ATP-binding subunit [Jiangella ureilytica]